MNFSEITVTVLFILGLALLLLIRAFTRRERTVPPGLAATLFLLLLSAVVLCGVLAQGTGAFFTLFALGVAVAGVTEAVALRNGMVGNYSYSARLGPLLLGVPVTVAVMWGIIAVAVYWSALPAMAFILGAAGPVKTWWVRLLFSLLAAFIATVFDLVMDPVMVRGGFWRWEHSGGWYGVPVANFIGWFFTTLAIFLLFSLVRNPFAPQVSGGTGVGPAGALGLLLPVMLLDLGWTAFSRKIHGAGWIAVISAVVLGWLSLRM